MLFLFLFLLPRLALPHRHVLRYDCAESHARLVVVAVVRFLFLLLGGGQQLAELVALRAAVRAVQPRSGPLVLRAVLGAEFLDLVRKGFWLGLL